MRRVRIGGITAAEKLCVGVTARPGVIRLVTRGGALPADSGPAAAAGAGRVCEGNALLLDGKP